MRRKFSLLLTGAFLLAAGSAFAADVSLFGDVFFWPRFQQETFENTEEGALTTKRTESVIRILRRANLGANLCWGEGFSGRVKLAVDNAANIIVMPNAGVAVMEEAYIAWESDPLRLAGGRLPIAKYAGSVVMDAHTAPANPTDAPFAVFDRALINGLSVDYRVADNIEVTGIYDRLVNRTRVTFEGPDADPDQDATDQDTVGLLSTIRLDALRLVPAFVMTLPSTDAANQPQPSRTSYGLDAGYVINGVALSAGVAMTSVKLEEEATDTTLANHVRNDTLIYRAGLGYKGFSLLFEMGTYTEYAWDALEEEWADDEVSSDLMHIAASYNYVISPGISVQPRIKYFTRKFGNATDTEWNEYSRLRLEALLIGRF